MLLLELQLQNAYYNGTFWTKMATQAKFINIAFRKGWSCLALCCSRMVAYHDKQHPPLISFKVQDSCLSNMTLITQSMHRLTSARLKTLHHVFNSIQILFTFSFLTRVSNPSLCLSSSFSLIRSLVLSLNIWFSRWSFWFWKKKIAQVTLQIRNGD